MPLLKSQTREAGESEQPESMRSAVIVAPRKIEVQEVPLPEPGPGQVRVRLEGCGVCASNGPVWEGRPWFEYPRPAGSPGHEGWGVVDQLGRDAQGIRVGDRVAMLSYHAFAEYDLASTDDVFILPEVLAGKPAPGEPLGCAVNVFRRSEVQSGQPVAIVGIGFLGALLVQLAKQAGAEVIAISRRPWALDLARECGAEHCIRLADPESVIGQVRQITGEGCPRVIEAVGNQAALDIASELVETRGKLIIAGFHQDGLRQVNLQSWNWRGIDVINAHERDSRIYMSGIREAFEALAAGQLRLEPLLTHHFSLSELDRALEISLERPDRFLKAYVCMDGER